MGYRVAPRTATGPTLHIHMACTCMTCATTPPFDLAPDATQYNAMNYSKGPEIKIFCKRVCTCTQSTQRTQCTQCTFVYKHILVFWHEDLHRGLAHVCCKELPPGIRGRFTEIFVDEADSSRTCPTDSFFSAFLFRLVLSDRPQVASDMVRRI